MFIENCDQVSPYDIANQAGIDLLYDLDPVQAQSCKADVEMRLARRANLEKNRGDDWDEEKWLELYNAAKAGKEDVVIEILKDDPKMLERKDPSGDYFGGTALHAAALSGNVELLKKMVGFIENSQDRKRLLLEGDRHDVTLLQRTVLMGRQNVAHFLVDMAPRAIYKVSRTGMPSPLCLAIDKGYVDLFRYMTRSDLPRSIREQIYEHAKKVSLAHWNLEHRKLDALQAILEGLPDLINFPDRKGWSLLSYAASKGYFEEFKYILKSFPDCARNIDKDGSYPIHKAVAGGHVNIVKEFLLHSPQALQDTDRKGRNPIQVATLYERKEVLSYLDGKEE